MLWDYICEENNQSQNLYNCPENCTESCVVTVPASYDIYISYFEHFVFAMGFWTSVKF